MQRAVRSVFFGPVGKLKSVEFIEILRFYKEKVGIQCRKNEKGRVIYRFPFSKKKHCIPRNRKWAFSFVREKVLDRKYHDFTHKYDLNVKCMNYQSLHHSAFRKTLLNFAWIDKCLVKAHTFIQ